MPSSASPKGLNMLHVFLTKSPLYNLPFNPLLGCGSRICISAHGFHQGYLHFKPFGLIKSRPDFSCVFPTATPASNAFLTYNIYLRSLTTQFHLTGD